MPAKKAPAKKAAVAQKPAPAKKAPAKAAPAKKAEAVPQTKSAILAAVADAAGISKKQAEAAYAKLIEVAYTGAKKLDKGIVLPGLGKLIIKSQKARTVRNPQTGAAIKKPACKVLKFRLAKAAKDAVLPAKPAKK